MSDMTPREQAFAMAGLAMLDFDRAEELVTRLGLPEALLVECTEQLLALVREAALAPKQ